MSRRFGKTPTFLTSSLEGRIFALSFPHILFIFIPHSLMLSGSRSRVNAHIAWVFSILSEGETRHYYLSIYFLFPASSQGEVYVFSLTMSPSSLSAYCFGERILTSLCFMTICYLKSLWPSVCKLLWCLENYTWCNLLRYRYITDSCWLEEKKILNQLSVCHLFCRSVDLCVCMWGHAGLLLW